MIKYDIVYIKGNPLSGSKLQHNLINNSIFELIKEYSYNIIESNAKNLSGITLPKAKIYIGFSRGSRYFKKLDNNSLKISIGGISASKVHLFKNKDDNILLGDISNSSMQAHFIISDDDKIKIKTLIDNHLNKLD
ncbi:hypothetical protein [Poseidonibacter antarcticus]|uniref:hypothetical protein n=1 Tax=Poseidonibacter antarcticus TaxID=2478538 RepID=UPI000EF46FBA|nr:hypothetical protein [Poseidonibacter antarcticus]